MPEITDEMLDAASSYDRANRGRPDGSGWTRVPNDQIRRLLDGLAEQGVTVVLAERLVEMEEDSAFLNALQIAGVDNWDGYSYACKIARGEAP